MMGSGSASGGLGWEDSGCNCSEGLSVISELAYSLAVTVACLILCIICIIQTVVQVCLCRKLRRERSVIFKHNNGKGEVNPMHWITDLESNVDRALDQPATSVSTPNLNVWYSPEIERKPQTFIPPREERRYSDARKPKTFMTPPKEERRNSDARKPKTFMSPPKEERRYSDARKPKTFMSPPKEERRNSDDKKPFIPPKEERRTSDAKKHDPDGMVSPEPTAPLPIPQATVKKSLSHGDLRSSSVKPKRAAPAPPNTRSNLSGSHGDLRESFSRPKRVAPSPPNKNSDTLPLLIKTKQHTRKENDYTEMEDEDDYENVTNISVAASIPSDSARESPTAGIYAGLNRHLRDRPADYAVPTRK